MPTPVNICVPICPLALGLNFSVTCGDTQDSKVIKYLSYCALRTKKTTVTGNLILIN